MYVRESQPSSPDRNAIERLLRRAQELWQEEFGTLRGKEGPASREPVASGHVPAREGLND